MQNAGQSAIFNGHQTKDKEMSGSNLTTVDFDAVNIFSDAAFLHSAGSPDIVIQEDGFYTVQVDVGIGNITNSRTSAITKLFLDEGNGFEPVPGSSAVSYHRLKAQGGGQASSSAMLRLKPGDVIRGASQRSSGSGKLRLLGDQCSITIKRIARS